MKKTFAMMLALIMVFATIAATVGTVSADEAESGFMVATLNDIAFDGELTITKGKNHELVDGKTSHEVKTWGTPHLAEYSLDVTLENGWVGAAYSIAKGELYLGVYAVEEIYEMEITAGNAKYIVDGTTGEVEGEGVAQATASQVEYAYEIILPLTEMELTKGERGIVTDISITLIGENEGTFEGQLLFSKYAAGFVYNAHDKSAGMVLAPQATDNGDGTVSLINDGTNARVYSIPNLPNVTKNLVIKFDLTVDSMPYSNPEDVATDGPGTALNVKAPHLWIALKYRFNENLYVNIQNTADDGLVLNVMEERNDGFTAVNNQHPVVLGKETGEKMVLELEWSEPDADGKCPVNVYVDGILVGTVESSMNVNPGLGKVSGVLQFNAQWTKDDGSSDTIDVTWGNVSVNEISALYNEDAYNGMANSEFGDYIPGDPNEGGNTGDTPDGGEDGGDDADNAPATDDKDDDTDASTDEEEKKGCGSSIAGIGLVAVLGSALTAVVATKKKED